MKMSENKPKKNFKAAWIISAAKPFKGCKEYDIAVVEESACANNLSIMQSLKYNLHLSNNSMHQCSQDLEALNTFMEILNPIASLVNLGLQVLPLQVFGLPNLSEQQKQNPEVINPMLETFNLNLQPFNSVLEPLNQQLQVLKLRLEILRGD